MTPSRFVAWEALLVADIASLRLAQSFCYLSLVTDICSRMIVGWDLSLSLEATGPPSALKMAFKIVPLVRRAIHHSDRGVQYCSGAYIAALRHEEFLISMGRVGCPQDNAVAERVNGILKGEFFLDCTFESFMIAYRRTADTIDIYNTERPHCSLGMLTPWEQFCKMLGRSSARFIGSSRNRSHRRLSLPNTLT